MVRLLIALPLLAAACSTVDSTDLRTSGITTHIVVSTVPAARRSRWR